jgi:putative ATP-binding cassette transporter
MSANSAARLLSIQIRVHCAFPAGRADHRTCLNGIPEQDFDSIDQYGSEIAPIAETLKGMHWAYMFAFLFQYSRRAILLSLAAGVLSGACNTALLAVINSALSRKGFTAHTLWRFIGLCALLPTARFISERLLNKLGQGALCKLRVQLCSQFLAAPLRHLEEVGTPAMLAVLNDDIPAITGAILAIPLICMNASMVIGCIVYMGILSPGLLTIVLALLVIGAVCYQIPINWVHKTFVAARRETDALQGHFRALTMGTKELKIHSERRRIFLKDGIEKTARSLYKHNLFGQTVYSAASSWGHALVFITVGVMLFLIPRAPATSIHVMIPYALTVLYLMSPLQVVMNATPPLSRSAVALKQIKEFGLKLSEQGREITESPEVAAAGWKTLQFRSVVHSYNVDGCESGFSVGPFDLTFKAGETVFIIGGNGSGKTTFIKLLTGLYLPEKGQILFDGRPVVDSTADLYRSYFSVVFADCYLFDELPGCLSPRQAVRAQIYLERLKLSNKVRIVNGRLSTTALSQGQRKRLALLSAYMEDRPVYIFDEWAADQDPHFRAVFYKQLLPELKANGKTIFVVSHDEHYYDIADRLIQLEEGRVTKDSALAAVEK